MKFHLSQFEAEEAIRKAFNIPSGCEIEIVTGNPLSEGLEALLKPLHPINDKIARIKALREFHSIYAGSTMGLADATFAIENYETFSDFIKKHNRFPNPNYCTYGGIGYVSTMS